MADQKTPKTPKVLKETGKQKPVTFIALWSPKQFFAFRGQKYRANKSKLITEDVSVIAYLEKSDAWEKA